MNFTISARCGTARAGRIETAHGAFDTPAFMPCGTKAAVKGLEPRELRDAGIEILLCNTYHLALRPGEETIAAMGGLQKFMAWEGPILTDSGGYQVFSLAPLRKITEEGVTFQSHLDGATVKFTPERVVEIQEALGSDIIMPLDEPIPFPLDPKVARLALDRTHAWWRRSRSTKTNLFGIIQGSISPDLRKESAQIIAAADPPGFALGGFSMGEPAPQMDELVAYTASLLPDAKPRYLMGVGMPRDILAAVRAGVDMFDCILPTRMGRTAMAFTSEGLLRLRNAKFARDERPLDPDCDGVCCRSYTRSYLRHCFAVDEMLGPKLLSLHNVRYYGRLMKTIRRAIREGTLDKVIA
ncbi:MAG TPA: tRNA guanosine(34) transglycosylase Tgt [Planctomycetota bacterium]|nr:tRNA guanosine(34) transglycosylase Tgt [Planctomycetota bacterium]